MCSGKASETATVVHLLGEAQEEHCRKADRHDRHQRPNHHLRISFQHNLAADCTTDRDRIRKTDDSYVLCDDVD